MSTRDNVSGALTAIALKTQDLNTDRKSDAVDTRAADGVKLLLVTGDAFTFTSTNKLSWRIQHSDTTTDGDFEAVEQGDVIGATVGANGQVVEYVAAITGGRVLPVGYRGPKRYVRAITVKGGTITNAMGTVVSELTYLHREGKTVTS